MMLIVLPHELLLDIFSLLPSTDIKLSVIPTCKLFCELIAAKTATGPIDVTLFRDVPIVRELTPGKGDNYKLIQAHPVFDRLLYELDRPLDSILLHGPYKLRLVDNPVASENATSPPAYAVMFCEGRIGPAGVSRSSTPGAAITVLDVMKALDRYFGTENWPRGNPIGQLAAKYFCWGGVTAFMVLGQTAVVLL